MAKLTMTFKSREIERVGQRLAEFSLKKKARVRDLTAETSIGIQADARNAVTELEAVDTGRYRSSIKIDFTTDGMGSRVGSEAGYGPYIEFGTGKMVEVPADLEAYASQFKGKGIREVNLPARPHLYPAFVRWSKTYLAGIRKIFRSAP